MVIMGQMPEMFCDWVNFLALLNSPCTLTSHFIRHFQLLVDTNRKLANHITETKKVYWSKRNLSDFEHGGWCQIRWYKHLRKDILNKPCGQKFILDVRGQRWMSKLLEKSEQIDLIDSCIRFSLNICQLDICDLNLFCHIPKVPY